MQQSREFYEKQKALFTLQLSRARSRMRLVSLLRLSCFLLVVIFLYQAISTDIILYRYLVVVSFVVFILLLRFFSGLRLETILAEKMLFINDNELDIQKNLANRFPGSPAVSVKAIYTDDLDVEGPGSLFHFINRTTTRHGSDRLSQLFNTPFKSSEEIKQQQNAVKELSRQQHLCQLITARGLSLNTEDRDIRETSKWFNVPPFIIGKKWVQVAAYMLPVVNISTLLYYLDSDNPIPFGIAIVFTWGIIGYFTSYISIQHGLIGKKQEVLAQYATILEQFSATKSAGSSRLQQLHTVAASGSAAIHQLSKLSSMFDQRLNLLVNIFLNSFLLYDIHCVMALEKWKEKNKQDFQDWVNAVGEIEMLISLSTFAFNHADFCFPEISEGNPEIVAEGMGHPLIPVQENVVNNVSIGIHEKLLLITGSNMSGKSTFLRSIGTNLLLAQCGAPVSASKFRCTVMSILSSIRINDSLQDHTSYFMAELKRLRSIIDYLQTGEPALVLVDEVLRGTNSDDKTHGSEALIRKLVSSNAITLFATHDLSLGRLENDLNGKLSNYCFESTIAAGELTFDYKLNRGIAQNRNATFLMHKMGIIS